MRIFAAILCVAVVVSVIPCVALGATQPEWLDHRSISQLEQASKRGDADATTVLAWRIDNGVGAKFDPRRATELRIKAAADGDVRAMARLGPIDPTPTDPDPDAAIDWMRKAAAAGDPLAMCTLAQSMLNGDHMAVDLHGGIGLLQKAASGGSIYAMTSLAFAYRFNWRLSVDKVAATGWATQAKTEASRPGKAFEAADFMGLCTIFRLGVGCPKDISEARHWGDLAEKTRDKAGITLDGCT